MWYSTSRADSRSEEIEDLKTKNSTLEELVKEKDDSIKIAKDNLAYANKRRKRIVRTLQKDKQDLIRRLEIQHKQHHESIVYVDSTPIFKKKEPEKVMEKKVEKVDQEIQCEMKVCTRCLNHRQDKALLQMDMKSLKQSMKTMEDRNQFLENYFETTSKELIQNTRSINKLTGEKTKLQEQSKALNYEVKKLKQEIVVLRTKLSALDSEDEEKVQKTSREIEQEKIKKLQNLKIEK